MQLTASLFQRTRQGGWNYIYWIYLRWEFRRMWVLSTQRNGQDTYNRHHFLKNIFYEEIRLLVSSHWEFPTINSYIYAFMPLSSELSYLYSSAPSSHQSRRGVNLTILLSTFYATEHQASNTNISSILMIQSRLTAETYAGVGKERYFNNPFYDTASEVTAYL